MKNEYDLYLSGYSIPEISEMLDIPRSTLRFRFKRKNILRERSEAVRNAGKKGKLSNSSNKNRVFSEEWKMNMSKGQKKRWEGKAKGYRINQKGYIEFTTGENKGRLQHVVVMENHIGRKINRNEVVHHVNKIRSDNRIENLQVMSISEHCRLHALERVMDNKNYDISIESKKGELHNLSKLTDKSVIEILRDNKPTKYYCEKFGVTRSVINKIKRRELWKHIKI